MQLSKPRLYEVYAFDATKNYTFKFTYTSGQAEFHELRIENASGKVIYDKEFETRVTQHLIPAGTVAELRNNKTERYKAYVRIGTKVDGVKTYSAWSDWVAFYCFDSPTLSVSGISNNAIVNDSALELAIAYPTTANGDTLNSYQVTVYNIQGQNMVPSSVSGAIYANGKTSFTYSLTGLEDNQKYSLQFSCETTNHLVYTSERIDFSVEYINPSVFANLECTNLRKEGKIKLRSNIVSILGKCGPTSRTGKLDDGSKAMPKYLNGKELDITGDGHWAVFDEGFNISDDFTLQLIVRNLKPYKNILTLYNGTANVSGPLILLPEDDDYSTADIIENHPEKTNVFDGKYVEDMVNPPSEDWIDNTVDVKRSNKSVTTGDMITIKYMTGQFAVPSNSSQSYVDAPVINRAYISVITENGVYNNVVHSDLMAIPSANTYWHIWIQRKNNVIDCKVATGIGGAEEWL